MSLTNRALKASLRIYSRLLIVYPEEFRKQYSELLNQAFHDTAKEAGQRRGFFGVLNLWSWAIPDLVSSAVRHHFGEGNKVMERTARKRVFVFSTTVFFGCWILMKAYQLIMIHEFAWAMLPIPIGIPLLVFSERLARSRLVDQLSLTATILLAYALIPMVHSFFKCFQGQLLYAKFPAFALVTYSIAILWAKWRSEKLEEAV